MNTLLNFVKKLNIDQTDRNLAMDYISYFGIEEDELLEYADEFVAVCYTYNEETGEGPTFPGGLSISGTSNNLNALLATGAAYFDTEGNQLTLASNATTYDEGDVTVKKMNE